MVSPSSLLMEGHVGGSRLSSQRQWCKHQDGHDSIRRTSRKHLALCQEPQAREQEVLAEKGSVPALEGLTHGPSTPPVCPRPRGIRWV